MPVLRRSSVTSGRCDGCGAFVGPDPRDREQHFMGAAHRAAVAEAEVERLRAERGTLLGIVANIRDEAMDAHELDAQSAPTGDELQRIIDYAERAIALIDLNAS